MKFKISVIAFLLTFPNASSETPPPVLGQDDFGNMACGPCAVINTLLQGDDEDSLQKLQGDTMLEKAKDFAERFGQEPSIDYKGRTAYSEEEGSTDKDLLEMVNRFRAESNLPPMEGTYLERRQGEKQTVFENRVHFLIQRSIAKGFPPLLAIRSASVELREKTSEYLWYVHSGHWVSVVELTKVDDDISLIQVADPADGRLMNGTIFSPSPRGCLVPMTYEVDENDETEWDWVGGDSCFFLSMPAMKLGTHQKSFHERTIIALRYLITPSDVVEEMNKKFPEKSLEKNPEPKATFDS